MVLQVVPFVDFGLGWNSAAQFNPEPNTLVSVGIGLNWQAGKHLNARLDWGIPLGRVPFEGDTWQDQGFLFTVIFKN
jgi:hemolysin activation/secretion protein